MMMMMTMIYIDDGHEDESTESGFDGNLSGRNISNHSNPAGSLQAWKLSYCKIDPSVL